MELSSNLLPLLHRQGHAVANAEQVGWVWSFDLLDHLDRRDSSLYTRDYYLTRDSDLLLFEINAPARPFQSLQLPDDRSWCLRRHPPFLMVVHRVESIAPRSAPRLQCLEGTFPIFYIVLGDSDLVMVDDDDRWLERTMIDYDEVKQQTGCKWRMNYRRTQFESCFEQL